MNFKEAFCYQKLFWPFTVWINCSTDLNIFANSRLPASNFKSFSRSLEQFFLTVGQNNFGKKYHFQYLSLFPSKTRLKRISVYRAMRNVNLKFKSVTHERSSKFTTIFSLPAILTEKVQTFLFQPCFRSHQKTTFIVFVIRKLLWMYRWLSTLKIWY